MSLTYKDIQFLLLYFSVDKSFLVTDVFNTSWNEDHFLELSQRKKVRITAEYDDSEYPCYNSPTPVLPNKDKGHSLAGEF